MELNSFLNIIILSSILLSLFCLLYILTDKKRKSKSKTKKITTNSLINLPDNFKTLKDIEDYLRIGKKCKILKGFEVMEMDYMNTHKTAILIGLEIIDKKQEINQLEEYSTIINQRLPITTEAIFYLIGQEHKFLSEYEIYNVGLFRIVQGSTIPKYRPQ